MISKRQPHAPSDLNVEADLLAQAMSDEWGKAARDRRLLEPAPLPIRWRRTTLPVAGPVSGATATRNGQARFDPLPGLDFVTPGRLRQGNRERLHDVYGGLASGRLVIVGAAGSGKSAAAILLLLDALRFRDRAPAAGRSEIPVPVLFTLHGWDPATERARDWIVGKLTEIPQLSGRDGGRRAGRLLDAGRIAVFLDGLDEIAEQLRPQVLEALSDQAAFRLVMLSRDGELATAARQAHLIGAATVELQPVVPAAAAEYLLRPLVSPPPAAWKAVTDALTSDSGGVIARALADPLALTLLRDAYPAGGSADEILDTVKFPTPAAIREQLLDQVVIAAYTPRPGQPPPRYSVRTAQQTLSYIAYRLNQDGTRDLAWWRTLRWSSVAARFACAPLVGFTLFIGPGVVIGLLAEIRTVYVNGSVAGFIGGIVTGLVVGAVIGLLAALIFLAEHATLLGLAYIIRLRLKNRDVRYKPLRVRLSRRRVAYTRREAMKYAVFWILVGSLFFAAGGWVLAALYGSLLLLLRLASRFMPRIVPRIRWERSEVSSGSPVQIWRQDVLAGLVAGLALGFIGGDIVLIAVITNNHQNFSGGLITGCIIALISGCWFWMAFSATYGMLVNQMNLAMRHRTPLRLMRFLEDARSRHVLRTVGPVYQFRHAALQDRLAQGYTGSARGPGRDRNYDPADALV